MNQKAKLQRRVTGWLSNRWKHILGIRAQSADLPQVTLVTCMFKFIFHSCSFIVSDECFRKLCESSRKHADLLNFVNFAEAFRKYFSKVYENSRSSPMMMNWQVCYRQLISASTHEASRNRKWTASSNCKDGAKINNNKKTHTRINQPVPICLPFDSEVQIIKKKKETDMSHIPVV